MVESERFNPLMELELTLEATWANIRSARQLSQVRMREVADAAKGLDSEDTSIVVSGSLAREEFTANSDIDWTLLIDGLADPQHHSLFKKIDEVLS